MPKFLVDEDMRRSSAELLRKLGHEAAHVRDIGLSGALDPDIFVYAQKENRIIISRDLGFSNLLDYPLGTHWGIVVFRVPNFFTAVQINKVLSEFLVQVNVDQLEKALTIVEPGRYRIRGSGTVSS